MNSINSNINDPQFGETGFKFSRAMRGYSPVEVDTVIETLARKNAALTQENLRLAQTLSACNSKIHQLTQGLQALELERQRESLRIADVLTSAGRTAEETVTDARQKAAQIIADANISARFLRDKTESDLKSARLELNYLIDIISTARQSCDRHYDKLDEVLRGAEGALDSIQAPFTVHPDTPTDPQQTVASQSTEKQKPTPQYSKTDPYTDFIKSIGFSHDHPKNAGIPPGKIIGHFGD